MKDKKTLITIIVLLVIILPMGIYGTIKTLIQVKLKQKMIILIKNLFIIINYTSIMKMNY